MNTAQKIRILRRLADSIDRDIAVTGEEIAVLRAPSECWWDVNRSVRRQINRYLNRLDLAPETFCAEMHSIIDREAPFAPYSPDELGGYQTPPHSFDQLHIIGEYLDN